MSRWLLLVLGMSLPWMANAKPLSLEPVSFSGLFDMRTQARLLQTEMLQRMGARTQEHELLGFEQHLLEAEPAATRSPAAQSAATPMATPKEDQAWLGLVREQMAVVPEPATLALLVFGTTGLLLTRRRRSA